MHVTSVHSSKEKDHSSMKYNYSYYGKLKNFKKLSLCSWIFSYLLGQISENQLNKLILLWKPTTTTLSYNKILVINTYVLRLRSSNPSLDIGQQKVSMHLYSWPMLLLHPMLYQPVLSHFWRSFSMLFLVFLIFFSHLMELTRALF